MRYCLRPVQIPLHIRVKNFFYCSIVRFQNSRNFVVVLCFVFEIVNFLFLVIIIWNLSPLFDQMQMCMNSLVIKLWHCEKIKIVHFQAHNVTREVIIGTIIFGQDDHLWTRMDYLQTMNRVIRIIRNMNRFRWNVLKSLMLIVGCALRATQIDNLPAVSVCIIINVLDKWQFNLNMAIDVNCV